MQDDGNLVLNDWGAPVWSSGTEGSGANRAEMQTDGNFVLYAQGTKPVWASDTTGSDAKLVVQDDRNVAVIAASSVLWSTGTGVEVKVEEVAVAAPAAPAAPPPPRTYTVKKGDTLSAIAKKYYGNAREYPKIVAANGIPNPDLIHPGDVLVIPD